MSLLTYWESSSFSNVGRFFWLTRYFDSFVQDKLRSHPGYERLGFYQNYDIIHTFRLQLEWCSARKEVREELLDLNETWHAGEIPNEANALSSISLTTERAPPLKFPPYNLSFLFVLFNVCCINFFFFYRCINFLYLIVL